MASADTELEKQLKDTGKQLSHPADSIDELLRVLDKVEKLLLKVDQSPKKSMIDALKPSMTALIQDSLLKHSDIDVKVAVASCISEITRITAPDAPYTDDQMRDVFELTVSSFEDLADRSSRSYNKRASILETVSKVRSCVIMLDLECDELIVKMFEHFLKSVRDYHLDSIFSSMESIMVLVIEESEEISADLLKPLLASVKNDRKGVLPVAHKLGKGVILKSADKLKPYMRPALTSLGESLDAYHKVVAAVCEGTTANFEDKDDNDSGLLQLADECKLEKGSVDEAQQAEESKLTTASSDHVDQACPKEEVGPAVENKSPKSVMSNGVNVTVKDEVPVEQEPKKLEEDKSQEPLNKEDTDDNDVKESKNEKEADTIINSVQPSDSSLVEADKEIEKDNDVKELENENEKDNDVEESQNQNEKDNDAKEAEIEAVIPSETKKDKDTVVESEPAATANVSSSQSKSVPDESSVRSKKKPVPQEDETAAPDETKNKGLTQEDAPEAQKQAGKITAIAKEVKGVGTVNKSEDGEASDSDDKPLKKSESKSKSTKQSGKKSKQPGKKFEVKESDAKKPQQSGKKVDVKGDASDSDDKPLKSSVKKGEKSKIAVEEDESDSDDKPLKSSVNKGEKSKIAVEEDENDSDDKPLKMSAKRSSSKKKEDGKKRGNGKNVAEKDQAKSLSRDNEVDISPKIAAEEEEEDDPDEAPLRLSAKRTPKKKDDGKKRGNDKNVAGKDQAKSLAGDDAMDISSKSAETLVTSAKRKRSTGKDEVSDTIKYDESLIGTKVKVWWPEDKAYYEGVVSEFYPAKKKHQVLYMDGDEEILNLKTQKWKILQEFSVRLEKEQITEAQSEEATPEIHKKKRSKTVPAESQQKIKDSAKRVGGVSSSGKLKGSTPKDNKSTPKTSGKSSDTAATTSNEAEKSKEVEEEETLKTSSKTKTVNKSKGKTPTSGDKSNSNGPTKAKSGLSNVKEPEDVKSTENTKGGSKSSKKRKTRT